ncbi:MAG: GNAT family N-acetyltransferase [Pseudomonadota bacterium]|uniref:GNAT family N-acetyltransferase n=1 Tax=Phenylobacterium sp. TaxID=1871053 RepID=UPI0025E6CBB9|nr:GNAT family N-acetyltransferase [Phenylobacterium sp.]MBT9471461.1 GNAT family N-acetyltransferase [Phenylobacterium sp.]
MASGQIDIEVAAAAERPLIEGLFQFYVYDFSELEPAGSEAFEPGADGLFAPYPYMDSYWSDETRTPLIIRRGGRPVGFALLNAVSHSGAAVDRNMAEFFVMRKHRRGGVASAAVRAILTRYPGRWEIAVAERNVAARAFWPRAVAATPGVRDLTTLQGDGEHWTGPILSFIVQP